jgi:hypothetical protein
MAHHLSEMAFGRAVQLVKAPVSIVELTSRVSETRLHWRRVLSCGDVVAVEDNKYTQHWPWRNLSKALCDHI